MSRFQQTLVAPVAAAATVKFFVNVYKDAAGNIEPGAKTYRTERNARNHIRSARGLSFVKTVQLEIKNP
jgi:hypothetical protein